MKVAAKTLPPPPPVFSPVTVSITLDTPEEAKAFFRLTNHSNMVVDAVTTRADTPEFRKLMTRIMFDIGVAFREELEEEEE